jgi:hypothetical protein
MDQQAMEQLAEQHAYAVVRGDMRGVAADLVPALREQLPEIGKRLPRPLKSADVRRVDARDDHTIVEIEYSGDDKTVTMQSRWEDRDGGPLVVEFKSLE